MQKNEQGDPYRSAHPWRSYGSEGRSGLPGEVTKPIWKLLAFFCKKMRKTKTFPVSDSLKTFCATGTIHFLLMLWLVNPSEFCFNSMLVWDERSLLKNTMFPLLQECVSLYTKQLVDNYNSYA